MADDIRVLGLAQVVKNLQTLSEALQKKIMRRAVRAAAVPYAKEVKATTYGGKRHRRTGLLIASQSISTGTKGDDVIAKVRMRDVNIAKDNKIGRAVRGARSLVPGAAKTPEKYRAFYWRFLEYGTKQRRTKSGADRGAVGESKWVRPAFDSKSDEAINAFRLRLASDLEAEAAKLPKGVKP